MDAEELDGDAMPLSIFFRRVVLGPFEVINRSPLGLVSRRSGSLQQCSLAGHHP